MATHADSVPPLPTVESPLQWGLDEILGAGVRSIEHQHRIALQYYRSVDHAIEVVSTFFGPTIRPLAACDPAEREDLLDGLWAVMCRFNRADDGTAIVENDYLQTIAITD